MQTSFVISGIPVYVKNNIMYIYNYEAKIDDFIRNMLNNCSMILGDEAVYITVYNAHGLHNSTYLIEMKEHECLDDCINACLNRYATSDKRLAIFGNI